MAIYRETFDATTNETVREELTGADLDDFLARRAAQQQKQQIEADAEADRQQRRAEVIGERKDAALAAIDDDLTLLPGASAGEVKQIVGRLLRRQRVIIQGLAAALEY